MSDQCVYDQSVMDMFSWLEKSDRVGLLMGAIRNGAKILHTQTVNQLRSAMGSAADHVRPAMKGGNNQSMVDGVLTLEHKWYFEIVVTIMGDYRNKWFEKGVGPRYTDGTASRGRAKAAKKYSSWKDTRKRKVGVGHWYRGQIQGTGFFTKARSISESMILKSIEDELKRKLDSYKQ